ELPVDRVIPAIRRGLARVGAHRLAVRRRAVCGAEIARLGRRLHGAVTAVPSERAVRVARAVRAVVRAVVALLGAVLGAVAAARPGRAVGLAAVVSAGVLRGAEIARLARFDDAVAALQLAVGGALVDARAVLDAVVALLAAPGLRDAVAAARTERAAHG